MCLIMRCHRHRPNSNRKSHQSILIQQQTIPEDQVNIVMVRGRQRSDAQNKAKPINAIQNNPYSVSTQFGNKKMKQQQHKLTAAPHNNKWETKERHAVAIITYKTCGWTQSIAIGSIAKL
eukprot:18338_1